MKTIKVEVPFELWAAFKKAYPRRGEGTEILRQIIETLVTHQSGKYLYSEFIAELVKEIKDGASN